MKRFLVLLFIYALSATAVCYRAQTADFRLRPASDAQVARAENNLPNSDSNDIAGTRIYLQTVSFKVPAGFQEQIGEDEYLFVVPVSNKQIGAASAPVEALSVERLARTGKTADVETCRREFKRDLDLRRAKTAQLGELMPGVSPSIAALPDRQMLLGAGRLPALLIGTITRMGERNSPSTDLTEREAFIFDTRATVIHLKYDTARRGADSAARFEQMLGSLRINRGQARANAQSIAGWTRRYAGAVTIETPPGMRPQRTFVYERASGSTNASQPDARQIIRLSLPEPDNQSAIMQNNISPLDEKAIADFSSRTKTFYPGERESARILSRRTTDIKTAFWEGILESYTTAENEQSPEISSVAAGKYAKLWASLKARDGTKIILKGTAPLEQESALAAAFQEWLQSFIPASEKSSQP